MIRVAPTRTSSCSLQGTRGTLAALPRYNLSHREFLALWTFTILFHGVSAVFLILCQVVLDYGERVHRLFYKSACSGTRPTLSSCRCSVVRSGHRERDATC
ncbi:hypothetical protein JG688_00012031 [Phytophthora aleatoria]|uniref:Uncharacterized protein n=1 Tax=Phytophthora aleatoria TaxID=2496075 RepID=A0A8J5J384_9STRA|nr:hypothetical protein JG688_00012031 [Phytophthora aleatoria]